jgi:hypothetical protein
MSTDKVIAGQVVEPDDDTAADENVPAAPETYFHKVAGPQRTTAYSPGYTADETPVAADPTATDPDLPAVDTTAGPYLHTTGSDVNELDDTALDDTALDDTAAPYDADEPGDPDPAASTVPASTLPASTPPASTAPASTLPASTLPASTLPASSGVPAASEPRESLFGDTSTLMEHWRQAAVEFVDDPRASVSHAAEVAAEAVTRLEAALREQRAAWDGNANRNGNGPDTEALRQAMLGYRRFLDRLLS